MSPTPSTPHPAPDDLLLWHSGEMDAATAAAVASHVRDCPSCRSRLDEVDAVFREVRNLQAASGRGRFQAPAPLPARTPFRGVARRLAFGTAALLVIAIALDQLTNLTPTARASELLTRAAAHAPSTSSGHVLRLSASGPPCPSSGRQPVPASGSSDACAAALSRLRSAGWSPAVPLSAESFRRWRDGLEEKRDTITAAGESTEITTTTDGGPLRLAMIRLRNRDYRVMAGRFEFEPASPGEGSAVLHVTTEDPGPRGLPIAADRLSDPSSTTGHRPAVDPLDNAEARVRLLLHRLGADRDALVSVERQGARIQVSGPTADPALVTALSEGVANDTFVDLRLNAGDAAGEHGSLPWAAIQGDRPPLAYERIAALFPNAPQDRERFVNELDAATRRLIAATRSRDAVGALNRRPLSPADSSALAAARNELQQAIDDDLALVTSSVNRLGGSLPKSSGRLSPAAAVELYTLVHEVVFLSQSGSSQTLPAALDRLAMLTR